MTGGVGYVGKTTKSNSEVTAVQAASEVETKMGELPGVVVSFDSEAQTAVIRPLYYVDVNGVSLAMPELQDVPVRFPRTSAGAMTFPVNAGDRVTLRPQMRSMENYHTGGDNTPSDSRYQSLSDMEAFIDGGEPLTDALQNFDNNNVHLRCGAGGNFGFKGSPEGKLAINGSAGELLDLIAQALEAMASDGLDIKYGDSAGTGHALQNKAQYENIAASIRAMKI